MTNNQPFLCWEYLRLNFLCRYSYQGILRVCVTSQWKIDANIYEYHSFFINTRHWLIEEHFLWIPFNFGQGEKKNIFKVSTSFLIHTQQSLPSMLIHIIMKLADCWLKVTLSLIFDNNFTRKERERIITSWKSCSCQRTNGFSENKTIENTILKQRGRFIKSSFP